MLVLWCAVQVRVYLTKQCSPTEQVKHTLSLQLALQTVVQETAAAAAKGAAAGKSLASAAALPAAAAVSTDPEQEEEEEEEEEMQAELLSLTPAPAAGHIPQARFNTPLHSHLLYSQMSSQEMALTQQQVLTQGAAAGAAAAAADAGGMSPIRRFPGYSNGSSPARVTPQQQQKRHCQQQQQLLPFCQACDGSTQAAATVLPAGSSSLDTAVSAAAAAAMTAAGSDRRVPVAVAKAAWEEIGLRPDGSKKAAGKGPHKAGATTHTKRAAEPGPGAGRHTRHKAGGAS